MSPAIVSQDLERSAERTRTRIRQQLVAGQSRAMIWALVAALVGGGYFAMSLDDWLVTLIRGLSVGAITFLVASGLSIIFGLMDVLNLAHGELFMFGAYAGWTMYVRPDTALDVLTPVLVIAAALAAIPAISARVPSSPPRRRPIGLATLVAGLALGWWSLPRFPLAIWSAEGFANTPVADSLALDSGVQVMPDAATFDGFAPLAFVVLWVATVLVVLGALLMLSAPIGRADAPSRRSWLMVAALASCAVGSAVFNTAVSEWLYSLDTTARFMLVILGSLVVGFSAGVVIELLLIRPLYGRALYQVMISLGLGFILIDVVTLAWGRSEFTMPKPAAFNGHGDGCPGQGVGGLFSGCSTTELFGSRIRTYNEGFVILVGAIVLFFVTFLLRRTRLGMVIRAGVEDSEMVEVLGTNVRRAFTMTFGLGVALAFLGGVIAAPSIGLSPSMGALFLLLALVAMAVGGLTNFAGTALGAVMVGLVQQMAIKYSQVGIPIPGLDERLKPTVAIVPASVIMLMVLVLLLAPNGLLRRSGS